MLLDLVLFSSKTRLPTFSVESDSSDGPSGTVTVSDFGINLLAQSETSDLHFLSIDGQEEVINMDTAESTMSGARDKHSSAPGDDSSSSGGDGFSLYGQDAVEKPSGNVQRNHDEDPSDDDEDSSDDVEDSPHNDESLAEPYFFTRYETVNQALIAQNEFYVDPNCVELNGKIHSAIWGVDGKPLSLGQAIPLLSEWRSTVAEAITKWETASSGSHDSTRLQVGDKIEYYNMFDSYWSQATVISIEQVENYNGTGQSETLYDLELEYNGTLLPNVNLRYYLWLFVTDAKDPSTECSKRTSNVLQLVSVSIYGGSSKKQRVSNGLVSVEGGSTSAPVCSSLPIDSGSDTTHLPPYPELRRLHMPVNHVMGKDKYKEMIKSGLINPLSSYPESVEVFLPVVTFECSSNMSKSNSTSSTPTDIAAKGLSTMFDCDVGFLCEGM
eukprot:scaffold25756_cov42-Cyclotella_meneghiniana.AAC.9